MRQKIRIQSLLLDVWREACRHIEIHESTSRIAALLAPHIPLSRIVIRRIDLAHSCVETVAAAATARATRSVEPARTACNGAQMKGLLTWCKTGGIHRRAAAPLPAFLRRLLPPGSHADALIGPLRAADGPAGLLVLLSDRGRAFTPSDEKLLASLVEPFSVAMENDRRLHEMTQLREAAEADRRTLLTKLGRKDVVTPIVGAEVGLRAVMDRVALVAASDVPVLLFGETGTGKEVIARAIHTQSPRAAGPFIRVNCGAIPPELIDSHLFGHERGSFTGATETRKGWFERADGGTLFLDEIGDLPLAAQVRCLRVLQDGCLERVGGQHTVQVNVRVIGATHRDLAARVRSGSFREDLWYRLAVFPISIPPLRQRAEDIGPLACHFAEKAATRFGLALAMPTVDDIRLLTSYPWPGNVRELQAVIDRAALLGNGRRLEVATALGAAPSPNGLVARPATPTVSRPCSQPAWPEVPVASAEIPAGGAEVWAVDAPASLEDVMRREIESALRACHGRVEGLFGAADRLRINPNTLRARMRKLRIDWRRFRPPPAHRASPA